MFCYLLRSWEQQDVVDLDELLFTRRKIICNEKVFFLQGETCFVANLIKLLSCCAYNWSLGLKTFTQMWDKDKIVPALMQGWRIDVVVKNMTSLLFHETENVNFIIDTNQKFNCEEVSFLHLSSVSGNPCATRIFWGAAKKFWHLWMYHFF